jgi:hypothetical protein
MNRDEHNTAKALGSSNPFAAFSQAPAAVQVRREGWAARQPNPVWDSDGPAPAAVMPPPEPPSAPTDDEPGGGDVVLDETPAAPPAPVEEEAPKPVRKLKPLRPPAGVATKPAVAEVVEELHTESFPPAEETLQEAPRLEKLKPIAEKKPAPKPAGPIIENRSPEGLPSYRCEFEGRDIMVGFPCYKTTSPVSAFILTAIALDFGREKIRFEMAIGDAIIAHARNRIAHKFLETDAKWLLMLDDDILASIGRPAWLRHWVQGARNVPEGPLQRHIVHRLIGSGKTLVGGAYFGRQEGGPLMCSDQGLYSRAKAYEDAVVPVDWVATGAMLVHRSVFDDIRGKFGDSLKINVPDYEYDYFRHIDGAHGEDVSFCKRAKEAGHQPHIDLGTPIFHLGYKTY